MGAEQYNHMGCSKNTRQGDLIIPGFAEPAEGQSWTITIANIFPGPGSE